METTAAGNASVLNEKESTHCRLCGNRNKRATIDVLYCRVADCCWGPRKGKESSERYSEASRQSCSCNLQEPIQW